MEERNPDLLIRQEGYKDISDDPEGKMSFIWGPQIGPTHLTFKISLMAASSLAVALVRERTIPTERPPPIGEVSANFCG